MLDRIGGLSLTNQQTRPFQFSRRGRSALSSGADDFVEQGDCRDLMLRPEPGRDLSGDEKDLQPSPLHRQLSRGTPQRGDRTRRVPSRESVERGAERGARWILDPLQQRHHGG